MGWRLILCSAMSRFPRSNAEVKLKGKLENQIKALEGGFPRSNAEVKLKD